MKILRLQKCFFYILLSCFCANHPIDLLKATIEPDQTIAIYTGAFDPPHLGHDEVIHYALSQGIDYVIVVPDGKFNRYKPFITNIKFRNILLRFLYNDEPSIITTSLDYLSLIEYLAQQNKKNKIVAILGSDNFLRHLRENTTPQLQADAWLIMPRENDKNNPLLNETKTFAGKPVLIVDSNKLKYQNCSSTQIRETVRANPEFYSGLFNPLLSQLPIDHATRSFIRDFKLYYNIPKKIAESNIVINQITETVAQEIAQFDASSSYTIFNSQQEGIGGFSDNLIFFVTDGNDKKRMAVKAFLTHAKDQEYDSELNGNEIFEHLYLEHSVPIKKLFNVKNDSYNLIGMELAVGKSFESIIKGLSSQNNAQNNFRLLGSALAELHVISAQKIEKLMEEDIKRFIDCFERVINEIEAHKSFTQSFDSNKMRSIKEKLINGFLQNPGCFSYLHGDAQPGNFFINDGEDQIIMIDLSGAAKYFDKQQKPKGFAAHEYYQFLSSLDLGFVHRFDISLDELKQLKNSFMEGYKAYLELGNHSISTEESSAFFKFYWDLRGIQNDLLNLKYVIKGTVFYHKLLSDLQLKLNNILN